MAAENVGWATLQIIPSARNFARNLRREIQSPMTQAGREAGKELANQVDEAGRDGARRMGNHIRSESSKALDDAGKKGGRSFGLRFAQTTGKFIFNAVTGTFKRALTTVTKIAHAVAPAVFEGVSKAASNAAANVVTSVGTAISSGAAMTAATGGLNLLVGALLAVAAAAATVATGFVVLAPVVLLAGGLFGSLATAAVGTAAAIGVAVMAFRGLGDALGEIIEDGEVSEETLRRLAPSARSFVREIVKLREPLSELARFVQNRIFDGLAKPFRELAQRWLPALRPMLGGLAGSFNRLIRSVFDALSQPEFIANFREATAGFGAFIERIGESLNRLLGAIGRLARASVPFFLELGDLIGGALDKFSAWIAQADKTGKLESFMVKAARALRDIWRTIGLVIGVIGELIDTVFPQADRMSQSFFGGVQNALEKLKKWLADPENKKKIDGFFKSILDFAKKVKDEWIPAIDRALSKIGGWLEQLDKFGAAINEWRNRVSNAFNAVTSTIERFSTNASNFLGRLRSPLDAAGRAFGQFRNAAVSRISSVAQTVAGLPGRIVRALGNVGGLLYSAGVSVIHGFVRGIYAAAPSIISAVRSAITDRLPGFVRRALGIRSPSRVFMALGEQVASGMAIGIERGARRVTRAMAAITAVPATLSQAAMAVGTGVPEVRVYIGERELTDIVRVEVSEHNRLIKRRALARVGW